MLSPQVKILKQNSNNRLLKMGLDTETSFHTEVEAFQMNGVDISLDVASLQGVVMGLLAQCDIMKYSSLAKCCSAA